MSGPTDQLPDGAEQAVADALRAQSVEPSEALDAVILAGAAAQVRAAPAEQPASRRWWRAAPPMAAAAAVVIAVGLWWQGPQSVAPEMAVTDAARAPAAPSVSAAESAADTFADAAADNSADSGVDSSAASAAERSLAGAQVLAAAEPAVVTTDGTAAKSAMADLVAAPAAPAAAAGSSARQLAQAAPPAAPVWARLRDGLARKFARQQRYTTVRRSAVVDPGQVLATVLADADAAHGTPVAPVRVRRWQAVLPDQPVWAVAQPPGTAVVLHFLGSGDQYTVVPAGADADGVVRVVVPDWAVAQMAAGGDEVLLYMVADGDGAPVVETWAGPVPGALAVVGLFARTPAALPAAGPERIAALIEAKLHGAALAELAAWRAEQPDDPRAALLAAALYRALGSPQGVARAAG